MLQSTKSTVKQIKNENKKSRFSFSSLIFAMIALAVTVVLFFGLIVLQNYLSEDIVTQDVIVAKVDIPEHTIITEENAKEFLDVRKVNVLNIPKGVVSDPYDILNQRLRLELLTGEMLTMKDFENVSTYTKDIKNPIEVSIGIESIDSADGGKLRTGDRVNLTMMFTNYQLGITSGKNASAQQSGGFMRIDDSMTDEEYMSNRLTDEEWLAANGVSGYENYLKQDTVKTPDDFAALENPELQNKVADVVNRLTGTRVTTYNYDMWAQYVMEDLYITRVLNAEGQDIDPSDTTSTASIIFFVIDKDEEPDMNNALKNCSNMILSKILTVPDSAKNPIPGDEKEPESEQPEETTEPEPSESEAEEEPSEEPTSDVPSEELGKSIEDLVASGCIQVTLSTEADVSPAVYVDENGASYVSDASELFTVVNENGVKYKIVQIQEDNGGTTMAIADEETYASITTESE